MPRSERFSCCFIGKGGLALECAEFLLERGHDLVGFISKNSVVKDWADEHQIVCADSIKELPPTLDLSEVDYIFSIGNAEILSESLLQRFRQFAINYHDAPLPKYAGVNATSWAILNDEKYHGITWHVMTGTVDGGDILKQSVFPIDECETTLTLNLKCYDYAFKAFCELVDELANKTFIRIKQDITQRTYYSLKKTCPGGGLISWAAPAEEIDRLLRALYLGSYPNEFGLGMAKFILEEKLFFPRSLEIVDARSSSLPGTIVAISDRFIQIATATKDMILSEVSDLTGQYFTAAELTMEFRIYKGYRLYTPDNQLLKQVTNVVSECSPHEEFWLKQLTDASPTTLPFLPLGKTKLCTNFLSNNYQIINIPTFLKNALISRFGDNTKLQHILLTVWLIYLYRQNSLTYFTIRFSNSNVRQSIGSLDHLFASDVPLTACFHDHMKFGDALQLVIQQVNLIEKHRSYLHDITLRHPVLRNHHQLIPLLIVITKNLVNFKPPTDSLLTIAIHEDETKFCFIINNNLLAIDDYQAEIRNATEHINSLLNSIVKIPHCSISQLPILTSVEKEQIITRWNDTHIVFPKVNPVAQLFEEQVEKTPNSVAVAFDDQRLTYQELNAKANQLAHHLAHLGVGPETPVAISVKRSLDLVIGMLGVLKAGGVYVPLDPDYPDERRAFMLEDTHASVLLVHAALKDKYSDYQGHLVSLDADWERIARESSENPEHITTLNQLAYVMYTSGSTGQPKGVMCTHAGLANRLLWSLSAYPITEEDCLLQIASVGFDISVWEMFFPLLAGGRLVVASPERHKDAGYLVDAIAKERVSVVHFVPSLLDVFLEHPDLDRCGHIKHVICGGEALSVELKKKFFEKLRAKLYHAYGPTEASISVTHWDCEDERYPDKVPLGRPIANTKIYILDNNQQPVPIGVTGELYIGGIGLARGYLNRPELTAEKFVADPFSEELASRLYKTGDLGRFLSDGNIEFVGRSDNQIKLRGYRIELGEIQAVLSEHELVRQAVVLCREDVAGDKRLIAYVKCVDDVHEGEIANQRLRLLSEHLANKLPEYMVPSRFMLLDSLPLMANGKVNRAALPKPNHIQRVVGSDYVAPRTALEGRLALVWSNLLAVPQIGIHDNFFALGGHSLLATRLLSWIRQYYAVELPLRCLFEFPTIASLSKQITTAQRKPNPVVAPPITPAVREAELPLSFSQERLWFLDQLLPRIGLYNIPVGLYLKGKLDVVSLQKAFDRLLARHEVLRSAISVSDGRPVQVIATSASFAIEHKDLSELFVSGLPEIKRYEAVQRHLQTEARKAFDISEGPLIRVHLYYCNEEEHILLVTTHHIVSDGWSTEVFFGELSLLYNAQISGQEAVLPELPIQYVDFAMWQRGWLQGEVLTQQLTYWKEQLSDLPERLQLCASNVRPKELSYQGAVFHQHLSTGLLGKIKTLAEERGATLFMTLLAAFQLLLHRYTLQDDIVVGSPFANRHYPEISNLVGILVNTLALRTDCGGDPNFVELLDRVRDTTVNAYEHQDCPFEKIVEYLQSDRDLNLQPIFQVMFVLNNDWKSEVHLNGLDIESVELNNQTSMFDLTLTAQERVDGLALEWEYSTDIFKENFIVRLAKHFMRLLEGIVSDPASRISALPLLSPEDIHEQLVEWNKTQTPFSNKLGVHQLFEEQVEKTPEAIAVVCGSEQLTYRELNSKANQIARYLRKLGVRPESPVALCIERSPNLIIGLLAILKAGGAYVPLAPSSPNTRLRFMLDDTRASVLLTQSALEDKFPSYDGQLVRMDHDWKKISEELDRNLENITVPGNLAYVIYTSGSTGKPKGVLIEHRSLLNYTLWAIKSFEFTSMDRVLQFASISFDAAAEEIYPTLTTGGTLVLRDDEMMGSLVRFFEACVNHHITVLDLPTAYWHQMTVAMVEEDARLPSEIRLVIVGGERVLPGRVATWHEHVSPENLHVRLVNTYGPTEATIAVTSCDLPMDAVDLNAEVPIGIPIANMQAYVLDSNLHPVPIGVTGELYIGGVGLARGYLNRPELTAEKFITNPYSGEENTIIYKTGDLVRWREDSQLEYVGRMDDQVKIRGFRIELREIETLLSRHGAVKDVAVVVRDEESGNRRLIAYIVGHDKANLPIAELRAYVKQALPDYMVPSTFVQLESLPLMTNGKIDRRALPEPNQTQRVAEVDYVAPRTALEKQLAAIWAKLLSLNQIGIHDNFFAIGGHSLLVTQLISRIRQCCAVELPLRCLFLSPTIAELAKQITQAREESCQPVKPPIKAIDREAEIPLSFAQQRLLFLDQLSPNTALYNMPVALNLCGSLDIEALQKAFNSLIARHESLRTKIKVAEGRAVQEIAESAPVTIEQIELTGLSEIEKEQPMLQHLKTEALRPFDLTRGPLIRVQLLHLSTEWYVLLVTTHHIVTDGWSMQVLFRDLDKLYCGYKRGQSVALPQVPFQYADFANWQRNPLVREVLDGQLKFWQKQLHNLPELLDLPTDRPRPKERSHEGGNYVIKLSPETLIKLKILGEPYQATLFMILLACFQAFLHRYTGQDDIVVGSPIANRPYPEVENTIGFFVNTLALRTSFTQNPSFEQLLLFVRNMTVNAYENQDVPFEEVVDSLGVRRALNRHPIFQVMFALEDASACHFKLDSLEIEEIWIQREVSKFDLALTAYDRPDGLTLEFEYTIDLFEQATIVRMANNFAMLVEHVIKNPKIKVNQIPLITDAERRLLLEEWNQTDIHYHQNHCLHQLFEAQVNKTPERIAIVYENQKLTYRELNQRANQLANYLIRMGVGPEILVAIHIDRSLQHIISVLGLLKAGGVYVPLELAHPKERLRLIMEDTNSSVVITLSHLEDKFKNYEGKILCLDRDWDKIAGESKSAPSLVTTPNNLAYIMYTSGSTGKPKGVMCTHAGITNRLLWTLSTYPITDGDTLLQLASISFDISVWEIFFPLLKGACLIVALPSANKDLKYLSEVIVREKVSVIHFVPSLLNVFLDHVDLKECYCIKQVVCGGEALSVELKKKFLAKLDAKLYHAYGPTEASISVTHWDCEDEHHPEKVPIGRPIANTKIYILDHNQQPVPIGVVGELYIGGIGVARGYLNRPEFTAEKFVADPFSDEPGARLYKTGDLARFLSDGNIEFVGRSDDQVKLRGYRIELGEIEAVLSEHPLVRQVVVLCREDVPGHKRLVAYVVSKDEVAQGATANQQIQILREHVAGKVPDYMVPSAFVLIEALPLTTSGKVNRKALPAADMNQHSADDTYVAPRTEIEERLVRIWSELLSVERIGVHDNFFEIGGDSIISIQVVSRARQQGLQLDVKHVFQSPTIAGLAALVKVEAVDTARKASQDVLVGEVPLTPIQHMFFDQHLATLNHYNQAMLLESTELLEVDKLKIALEHLLVHHDALRLRFKKVADSQWMQEYVDISSVKESNVALCEFIDISAIPAQQQPSVIEREANRLQARLDIERGPVFGAGLFDCGARQSQRLLVVAHHLVVDAVSWSILLEDLTIGYRQLTCGEEVRLPAKTHSYRDWAKALREYADAETLRGELSYWLASASAETTLPVDYEQRENTEAYSETLTVNLGREETQKLLQQVPHAYRTQMPDVLLTALVQAIGDWTGRYSLLLSLESHGRAQIIENIDSSRTCGWFTSIFPVYLQLQEPGNIARSLKEIKEQLRTIPNDGIGYGVLCYLAKVDKEVSQLKGLPQPPLSFNYLGQRRSKPTGDSLLHYTNESIGVSTGEANERKHQLEVTSEVVDGCLKISWSYSRLQYERATVQHVVTTFIECLEKLIERCSRPENFGYTPSDFPLARMEQSLLDELFADRRGIEDIYPLAPMQAGFLFRELYEPDSSAYFVQMTFELEGNVNETALQNAWQYVTAHHAILRTAFVWQNVTTPVQCVMESVKVPWQKHDWRMLSREQQEEELELLLRSDRNEGLSLSTFPPLLRLHYIALSADCYYLIWSHHHILLDGWSLPLVLRDVLTVYGQLTRGEPPYLTPSRPYQDFIQWLQQRDEAEITRFWRNYLSGFSEPTLLAPNRLNSSGETSTDREYGTYEFALSFTQTNYLKQVTQRYRLTVNTILQGAWSLLLSRYSQKDDIMFGVSVSGRPTDISGVENMVGVFINTLPLRVQISPEDDVFSLLQRIQEQTGRIHDYSYISLAKIQSCCEVSRGRALFDTLFVFENYPMDSSSSPNVDGFNFRSLRAIERTEYPLTVTVLPNDQLRVEMSYNADYFDAETIQRLAEQFNYLLQGIADSLLESASK